MYQHTLGLNGPQTLSYVNHAVGIPNGQDQILTQGSRSLSIVNEGGETVKRLLLTRLDTFRFGNLSDEEVIRLIRHELMGDADKAIDERTLYLINVSLPRATNYLNNKGYPLPRNLPNGCFHNENSLLQWIKQQRKTKDGYVTRNVCRYLQVVNAYHTLLMVDGVSIDADGNIDVRDRRLINNVLRLFGSPEFNYNEPGDLPFSKTNTRSKGAFTCSENGHWQIPFYANFRIKNEERGVQKFIQSPEYDVKSLIKDMHGMRIEVPEPAHAFKMMEYIVAHMDLSAEGMEVKNRDMCSQEDWQNWSGKHYFSQEFVDLLNEKTKFGPQTKMSSAKRRELKFSCANPSFEVQFVLVNNTNETAYAYHTIYECIGDIFEKIRLDGYCNNEDIEHFMNLHIDEQTIQDTGLKREHIKVYILQKLIPIKFSDISQKKAQYTTISSIFRMVMGDLASIRNATIEFPKSTKTFNAAVIYGKYAGEKVVIKDLIMTPELLALIDDEIDENNILPPEVVEISSGTSIIETSSPPQRRGRQFGMSHDTKIALNGVLEHLEKTKPSQ